MRVVMASDNAGYAMKIALKGYIESLGHTTTDVGTHDEERCDYPVYGKLAAEALLRGDADFMALVCGTGFGISLAANKYKGIRCVNCSEPYTALLSRRHNDANGLSLGARVVGLEMAKMIVDAFLSGEFEGGRHAERVAMLE